MTKELSNQYSPKVSEVLEICSKNASEAVKIRLAMQKGYEFAQKSISIENLNKYRIVGKNSSLIYYQVVDIDEKNKIIKLKQMKMRA